MSAARQTDAAENQSIAATELPEDRTSTYYLRTVPAALNACAQLDSFTRTAQP
jgi:hypothetical protein